MKKKGWLKERLAELGHEDVLVADGLDDAAIGVVERCGQQPFVVYDLEVAAAVLADHDNMTLADAVEYLEFNAVGAWVGDATPGFIRTRLDGAGGE